MAGAATADALSLQSLDSRTPLPWLGLTQQSKHIGCQILSWGGDRRSMAHENRQNQANSGSWARQTSRRCGVFHRLSF